MSMERLREERGTTLAEVLVTMVLLGAVLAMAAASLDSMQRGVARAEGRSRKNDEVRLALAQIDREIRSGNVLLDPALEQTDPAQDLLPNMSLRIYTQAFGDDLARAPGYQCVQWRIADGQLQTRMWPDSANPPARSWRTVASDIANRDLTPPVPAFELDPTGRTIEVSIVVDRGDDAAKPLTQHLAVTGRNTVHSYNTKVCEKIAPYAP